jgi:hypothetical protein
MSVESSLPGVYSDMLPPRNPQNLAPPPDELFCFAPPTLGVACAERVWDPMPGEARSLSGQGATGPCNVHDHATVPSQPGPVMQDGATMASSPQQSLHVEHLPMVEPLSIQNPSL